MEDGSPPLPPPPPLAQAMSLTSEVTGDNASTDSVESHQESLATESMSTEWTDEKHSLYLKSMETSFVNDLYNSFDFLGWRSQRECSSDPKLSGKKHANIHFSSGQFKVLRSGYWGEINFQRQKSQMDKADGSGVILANPWVRHFRSVCRQQIVTPPALHEKEGLGNPPVSVSGKMTSVALAANLEQFPAQQSHLCHHDSAGGNTEVTDQNFVDEDIEGEKVSHRSNAKRMKISVVSTPSNDQVVPFGNFPVNTRVPKNSFSPERERPCGSSDLKSPNEDGVP